MKLISVSILFISLVAATFSDWCIIFTYTVNQQYISEALCENRSNPSLHCNGHCFLNKQLTNEEKPSSPLNTKSNERFDIQLFCVQLPLSNTSQISISKTYYNQTQNFTAQQFICSNFHPPQV